MRALFVVTTGTLASRLLGFTRDAIFAALFGAGVAADAFLLAFQMVTVVRRLLTEGALNAVLVPGWIAARRDSDQAAAIYAGHAMTTIGLGVAIVAIAMALAMPWLIAALAPGFIGTDVLPIAARNAVVMLPYLAFAGPAAVLLAILNAQRRVAVTAVAPALFNATLIICAIVLIMRGVDGDQAAFILAVAVGLAGVLQLGALAIGGHVSIVWTSPRLDPATRRLITRAMPGMVASAAPQLLIVIAAIAASHEASSVSRLYFASRLIDLPLGLVATAASAIVLPRLASQDANEDGSALAMLAFALPAAVGLAILAEPIVAVVFERGAFDATDRAATAQALRWLALGLPALALSKAWMAQSFARHDVMTPLLAALLAFAVTGIASAAATTLAGIAATVSAGGWAMAAVLFLPLRRRAVPDTIWIAIPSLAMAAVLAGAVTVWPDPSGPWRVVWLAAMITLGIAVNALTLAPWLLRLRRRVTHGKGPPQDR